MAIVLVIQQMNEIASQDPESYSKCIYLFVFKLNRNHALYKFCRLISFQLTVLEEFKKQCTGRK